MKNKICNQFFIKDQYRDKTLISTLKCACCNEESTLSKPFPVEIDIFMEFINSFTALHESKGCNENQLDPPYWAAGTVTIGISPLTPSNTGE